MQPVTSTYLKIFQDAVVQPSNLHVCSRATFSHPALDMLLRLNYQGYYNYSKSAHAAARPYISTCKLFVKSHERNVLPTQNSLT